jgi:sec-independent protein translocase protein TatB
MFDFDAGKLLIVGIVALAVIPPKDLPRVLRTVGQYVGKMRRMASEFQGQFMDAMKEAERAADLESMKKEFSALDEAAKIDTSFDPAQHLRAEIGNAVEPPAAVGTSSIAVESTEPIVATRDPFSQEIVAEPREPAPPAAEPAAPSPAP